MLGSYIRITIDPVFDSEQGKNTGRICGLNVMRGTTGEFNAQGAPTRVYVFSPIVLKGIVKLKIVGLINDRETSCVSYAAAPDRVLVFEPQIREALSADNPDGHYDIQCISEKSCGAVIYRHRSGNLEFLLVKNKKGGNWGFPKGHIEVGESEKDTARREVREETGLEIEPLDDFRVLSEYYPRGKIFKQVVFFLAQMPEDGEISLQQAEIDRYIWADYGLAMRTFRFSNDRNVLTKARARLKMS